MKKNFKIILFLLVLCMMTSTFIGCSNNEKTGNEETGNAEIGNEEDNVTPALSNEYTRENPLIWRLNSNQGESEVENCAQGQAYLHLKQSLEEKTDGAFQIEMYYNSQLGKTNSELINGAQFGAFELFNLICSSWGEYSDAFLPINVPYLFTDEQVLIEFLRGEQGKIMSDQLLADTDIRIAFYAPLGFRNIYNNVRPIEKPEDFNGIKMRTMSDKYIIGAFNALGASSIAIPYSELYTSLQQGLADGADNPYVNILNAKHYEVTKYLSEIRYIYCTTNLCVSDLAYSALPDEFKEIFDETCLECFEIAAANYKHPQTIAAIEFLSGEMEYNVLDEEQVKPFVDATANLRDDARDELGEERWNEVIMEIERIEEKLAN